ncbi:hypothetical protein [Micromonospora rosaria]|uniref:hypothetical protein n=1 Tax=Micromonospora rosaria TaxID=47874 RepID=UPI0012FB511F|nr:hypothetical protein [Micromonospora rosaria]
MRGRQEPLLVRTAWCVLRHHRHHDCPRCTAGGWCPTVHAARTRIVAWQRYRSR